VKDPNKRAISQKKKRSGQIFIPRKSSAMRKNSEFQVRSRNYIPTATWEEVFTSSFKEKLLTDFLPRRYSFLEKNSKGLGKEKGKESENLSHAKSEEDRLGIVAGAESKRRASSKIEGFGGRGALVSRERRKFFLYTRKCLSRRPAVSRSQGGDMNWGFG